MEQVWPTHGCHHRPGRTIHFLGPTSPLLPLPLGIPEMTGRVANLGSVCQMGSTPSHFSVQLRQKGMKGAELGQVAGHLPAKPSWAAHPSGGQSLPHGGPQIHILRD